MLERRDLFFTVAAVTLMAIASIFYVNTSTSFKKKVVQKPMSSLKEQPAENTGILPTVFWRNSAKWEFVSFILPSRVVEDNLSGRYIITDMILDRESSMIPLKATGDGFLLLKSEEAGNGPQYAVDQIARTKGFKVTLHVRGVPRPRVDQFYILVRRYQD